jgi:hypothetical protein
VLLFSGTVFTRGWPASVSSGCRGSGGGVPTSGSVWRSTMDRFFRTAALDPVGPGDAGRADPLPGARGLTSWEQTLGELLPAEVRR